MASLCQTISSFSSNPLVSAIVALYTLIFLYFPSPFRRLILFSPLLVSSSVLFFSVLRLRSSLRTARFVSDRVQAEPAVQPSSLQAPRDSRNDGAGPGRGPVPDPDYEDSFVEWNVRAPLEVIQEEYEEVEGEDDDVLMGKRDEDVGAIERYASLSLCYPETDSDSCSSDGEWGSPGNDRFRWEGLDGEELIEIKLSGNEVLEEDNLIEIDL